ncbi:hypothetical protein U1Q18_011104 [Sarracenia purpurea var. burkii]
MDRRSWLWRRKSSEKSPGETESSGSVSSQSERFYDDQACSNPHTHSPEVTSKSIPTDEELNDSAKTLTEKLSAALVNIRAKENLVKQHAKVAEEAVSGWEKAESEVLALKQQLEAATQKNTALEDRVGHLDGALKECVRQLRQAREEHEQKIHAAIANKTHEWEHTKSQFESQIVELQFQIQATRTEALTPTDSDLQHKLDAAEKENTTLKHELLSRAHELEIRIIERDLSIQSAETASRLHLESIKKVAKLEAECRRLKAVARKASSAANNDHRSVTASSVYVESFTDSQSDSGERLLVVENDGRKIDLEPNEFESGRSDSWASALIAELDQFKNEKALGRNLMVPSVEINLMDDFLEMERLAALPVTENGSCCPRKLGALSDQPHQPHDGENPLKVEFETMIIRTAELEEKLEKMEMEKAELEMTLTECQDQLKTSRDRLIEAEVKLVELQSWLAMANEARSAAEAELKTADAKKKLAESQLLVTEADIKTLLSKNCSLEEEVRKEQALSEEAVAKYRKLEDEILKMKREDEIVNAVTSNGDSKIQQEKELAVAASKLAECQKTIASLGKQLKSLATLDDFLMDSDKPLELPREGPQLIEDGPESRRLLHSGDLSLPKMDPEAASKIIGSAIILDRDSLLSEIRTISAEKSRNGFGKMFPRSNSRRQNENQ